MTSRASLLSSLIMEIIQLCPCEQACKSNRTVLQTKTCLLYDNAKKYCHHDTNLSNLFSEKIFIISPCFTHSQDTAVRFSSIIQRKVQLTTKRHWNENHTHRPAPWGGNECGSVGLGSWIPLRISACPTTLGQAKWVGLQD